MSEDFEKVLTFWFEEAGPKAWWSASNDFDLLVRTRFEALYEQGARGALDEWSALPRGALGLIILLDQFPRNMYRGTPKAYATDTKACIVTKQALLRGFDDTLSKDERHFLYMPLMHSEDLEDQEQSVELGHTRFDDEGYLKHAQEHRDVIARFGRFPHRNGVLGRASTPEEEEYLAAGGGWG